MVFSSFSDVAWVVVLHQPRQDLLDTPITSFPCRRLYLATKCSINSGMSSRRSRRLGNIKRSL